MRGGVLSSTSVRRPGTKRGGTQTTVSVAYCNTNFLTLIVPQTGLTSPSVCLLLSERSGGAVTGDLIEQRDGLLVAKCLSVKLT